MYVKHKKINAKIKEKATDYLSAINNAISESTLEVSNEAKKIVSQVSHAMHVSV